jgi:hypothetical protein
MRADVFSLGSGTTTASLGAVAVAVAIRPPSGSGGC